MARSYRQRYYFSPNWLTGDPQHRNKGDAAIEFALLAGLGATLEKRAEALNSLRDALERLAESKKVVGDDRAIVQMAATEIDESFDQVTRRNRVDDWQDMLFE